MKKTDTIAIEKKLSQVFDPELNISIVDMGLIYGIETEKNRVKIVMTLTTPGCPLSSVIEAQIKEKLTELGFKAKDIEINIVFDPPWTLEKMSKKARKKLGI
ncbi:metal-sulfur cluster assembly factor [Candidatus Roizmanbacteria bacterium]|jgi:metal-sulfur cluster biosynthetic enzyme|nr:metal-sulfur cluster assembly factor [Candidatus Roizmanbacteria bacterium]